MPELWEEINIKTQQLDQAIKQLRKHGCEFATAEREYKIALRQEVLKLRDEGCAIGVIDKIAYGIPSIAEKRMLRDIAQTTYEANKEAINVLKLEIKLLDNQYSREYQMSGKDI